MKQFTKLRNTLSGLTLSVAVVAAVASGAHAAPATPHNTPPAGQQFVSGPQAKPEVAPGTKDAKQMNKLGPTTEVQTTADGKVSTNAVSPMVGNSSSVDYYSSFYNYCWKNLVYTTVKNNTSSTQYIRAEVYNNGAYHDVYTSVAAGSYAYPAFYGIEGAYSAYLYVWNGSSYVYDEYKAGNNTCSVAVTRTYNTGGWVQLKIQNVGTAYASQVSTELAPYPGSGTYTGTQYDYPAAGGAAIYRWFYVGTQPYGITSYTYGSTMSPYFFTGDL